MNGENAVSTIGAYYEKYQYEKLCEDRLPDVYLALKPEVHLLIDRVEELAPLFSDMLYEPDSLTGKFIAVQEKGIDDSEWHDTFMDRPEQLEYFMYSWFLFGVEDLGDFGGGLFST